MTPLPSPQAPLSRAKPLVHAAHLSQEYVTAKGFYGKSTTVRAIDEVSLTIAPGEILGIVGESGSGKSTLGRMLLGLERPHDGAVLWDGAPMPPPRSQAWRDLRAQMQLIFQDPLAALDRRIPILDQIAEPFLIHGLANREDARHRALELMEKVGLRPDQAHRYPHELSGGQRQRVVIARALSTAPKFLVCDEPVSALDVSIQAQVVNLLRELQAAQGLTMAFISHDLKVVRNLCDRVVVMYLGRVVEEAPTEELFSNPTHPYTQALISAVPRPGRGFEQRVILHGEPPNPADRPSGCAFHPRCPIADAACAKTLPSLSGQSAHRVACIKRTFPFVRAA